MDARDFAKPWIKGLKPYVPGETHEGCIKLSSNENNYGPSPKVSSAVRNAADGVFRYPYKTVLLREKIAEYVGVSSENVICGNGSDEVIELIVKAFKGPAASTYPSFSEYKIINKTFGNEFIEVKLGDDFVFDIDEFVSESADANMIFLDNPNNPTGGVIARDDIIRVLDEGKITVIDEAYYEFYGESVSDLINDYPNLIVLRTFSKAFGLGGLRVGYAVACKDIIELLDRVRPPFNVNSLAMDAALAALDDVDYMKKTVDKIVEDRNRLSESLASKLKVFPSQTNFLLMDVSPSSAQEFFERMLERKIVVRKFGRFEGFEGEFIRITVGTKKENEKLIEALENA